MIVRFLPCVSLLLVSPAFAQTQPAQSPQPSLVTTEGSADVLVVPDLADLSFQIEVRNPNLAAASKEAEIKSKAVLAQLRKEGVAENDLQASQLEVTTYNFDGHSETEKVQFYIITQTIGCTLHDISITPKVTMDALRAGVTHVNNMVLRTSQLRKYRDQARVMAVRAAKQKATNLATELGEKLGRPYSITESAAEDSARRYYSLSNSQVSADPAPTNASDDSLPTFAPGTIHITATVTVAFRLE